MFYFLWKRARILAHIRVIKDNNVVKEFNCKLAVNKVDYSVPLDVSEFGGDVLLDIQFTGEKKNTGSIHHSLVGRN